MNIAITEYITRCENSAINFNCACAYDAKLKNSTDVQKNADSSIQQGNYYFLTKKCYQILEEAVDHMLHSRKMFIFVNNDTIV